MPIIYEDAEIQVIETITTNGKTVQTINKPGSRGANRETIMVRASAALTTNATFLALANPTTAQAITQVKVLTRECNGLIRLLLGAFTDVSDT
jgi:hypothetical protein